MADENKEYLGITINEATLQGIVDGDPTIVKTANGQKCAFLNLKTVVSELAGNGQWVETTVLVPLVVTDHRKAESVEKYVKNRKQIMVKAYYKGWHDSDGNHRHGMIVKKMVFGSNAKPASENSG